MNFLKIITVISQGQVYSIFAKTEYLECDRIPKFGKSLTVTCNEWILAQMPMSTHQFKSSRSLKNPGSAKKRNQIFTKISTKFHNQIPKMKNDWVVFALSKILRKKKLKIFDQKFYWMIFEQFSRWIFNCKSQHLCKKGVDQLKI